MQTINAKSVVAARPVSRSAVVVRASAESRRAVLTGFVAGAAALLTNQAQALTPIDLFDDRKVKNTGFDLIYEARELDLPQSVRDGLTQARGSIEETKARVKASEARIDSAVEPYINKAYWTLAREELRGQVGTLRFDLNTLASSKGKEAKKKALELRKEFLSKVEALDFALRQKDQASAATALTATKAALDNVLAFVL